MHAPAHGKAIYICIGATSMDDPWGIGAAGPVQALACTGLQSLGSTSKYGPAHTGTGPYMAIPANTGIRPAYPICAYPYTAYACIHVYIRVYRPVYTLYICMYLALHPWIHGI